MADTDTGHPSYLWHIVTVVGIFHVVALAYWLFKVVVPEKPIKQD
eukprot:CAMPEP_0114118974 /NCGR_PEP_ID=MMETSP0043_2-20121206/5865_1 /TAXON_ID=464988 /ORGANISM="Hemiselmis andersenii, Strain CCMP644" /LENGTH=44 /DNA_ID= /DNA_START= /DNA_END= /DNA_ORIENTATION=